ncbi:hypothetical protein ABGB14_19815 [Nonomuraea sp. B10E15]|uniref:PaaI family thioesterase n=1 Tax=Nonomuraea sp. B10E15 TaxID=3153560 RepID=UPI00325EB596
MPLRLSHVDVLRSVRRDVAESAETGAPPLGHLAGLHRVPTQDGSYALAFDLERPLMAGGPGLLEIAMLTDLALGGAIRNQVGRALPMPTISMTLQLAPGRAAQVAAADSECTGRLDRTATARSQLKTAAGEIVGDAQGVFALPAMPYDGPERAMPWDCLPGDDAADTGGGAADDLTSWTPGTTDAALVDRIVEHASRTPRCAWGTAHVEQQLTSNGENIALTPTEPMANRLGHVQGGALFTAAVLAAARRGEFPVDSLVTGTIEFIDAVRLDDQILTQVSVLRASGRSLFASVLVDQGERRCCHVTTVFRRDYAIS